MPKRTSMHFLWENPLLFFIFWSNMEQHGANMEQHGSHHITILNYKQKKKINIEILSYSIKCIYLWSYLIYCIIILMYSTSYLYICTFININISYLIKINY